MKRKSVFLFCMLLLTTGMFAQTGFSYQAVLRHADGTLRANESLNLTAELLQNAEPVYTETHSVETNEFGAFTLVIGQGATGQAYSPAIFLNTDSTGIVQTVLKISESGGNVISETNLLGVPYAEVAKVALKAHADFPAGVIFPFAGPVEKIPAGWLICDGTSLNKVDYPDLYDAIGTAWGEPSAETFSVPDLRGVFLRGVSGSSGDSFADPNTASRISRKTGGAIGNNPGSYQADAFESHNHDWGYSAESDDEGFGSSFWEFTFKPGSYTGTNSPVKNSGGQETRPSNAYVNYIIKY